MTTKPISIIGGGAWGLSLGLHYHRSDLLQAVYTRYTETIKSVQNNQNTPRLLGAHFPTDFPITSNLHQTFQADVILIASTVKTLSCHLERILTHYSGQDIILCCKGQSAETYALPHQIAEQYVPKEKIYLLSGPSFAADIAAKNAVAVTLAGADLQKTKELAQQLNTPLLRLYATDDLIGVALGGAYKNVLAIAAGIARGLQLGASAEAAMITRGLVELQNLATALGGKKETMFGLAGLGDLVLSCNSTHSRNFRYGLALGQGQSVADARDAVGAVVEGYFTTRSLPYMIDQYNLDLPICTAVHDVLFTGTKPQTALQNLLSRPGGKIE